MPMITAFTHHAYSLGGGSEARGCAEIELGSTSYAFKRILGAEQRPTWNYFQHQSRLLNWLLTRFSSLLEPSAEDLK